MNKVKLKRAVRTFQVNVFLQRHALLNSINVFRVSSCYLKMYLSKIDFFHCKYKFKKKSEFSQVSPDHTCWFGLCAARVKRCCSREENQDVSELRESVKRPPCPSLVSDALWEAYTLLWRECGL